VYLCIYYHMKIENKVKSIVKLINTLYSPDKIKVRKSEYDDEMLIDVYFSHIDDSYVSNPQHWNVHLLKSQNMERDIRKTIKSYLDIDTSGNDPNTGFSPYKVHGITIDVLYTH
jgi:hypothetical protein